MYHEIDLHDMNYEDALRIFIIKYNEILRKKDNKEICIIHGYGSKQLESSAVLKRKLQSYLSRQKGKLTYRLTLNPGVTYVKPISVLEWKGKKKK